MSSYSELHVLCRKHSVPLILCNYDGFYNGLMHFLKACDTNGTLAARELKDVMLADSNEEVRHLFHSCWKSQCRENMILTAQGAFELFVFQGRSSLAFEMLAERHPWPSVYATSKCWVCGVHSRAGKCAGFQLLNIVLCVAQVLAILSDFYQINPVSGKPQHAIRSASSWLQCMP